MVSSLIRFPKLNMVLKDLRESLPECCRVEANEITSETGEKGIHFKIIIEDINKQINVMYAKDQLSSSTAGTLHNIVNRELYKCLNG